MVGKAGCCSSWRRQHRRSRTTGRRSDRCTSSSSRRARPRRCSSGIGASILSSNGEKMLYRQGDKWLIARHVAPPKPGEGALKIDQMEVRVDPVAEWKQMYHEVWRIERDFFYDPSLHGLEPEPTSRRSTSSTWPASRSREDLNYLFDEMLGESDRRPHVRRRRRRRRRAEGSRAGCSARTTRSRTAATGSPRSTTARTGTPDCVRR